MADNVRQRMIREAALILARKGLQRTSFSEVLDSSGAPRGSLYHHFPGGKDELVLAALDAASDFALHTLERAAGRPAPEVAQAFIELWRGVLVHTQLGGGCAVVAVTIAADSPGQLARAGAIFRGWRKRLATLLAQGGVAEARAAALAATLIAGCEGAVALARAEQSLEPFEGVAQELIATVRAAALGQRNGE